MVRLLDTRRLTGRNLHLDGAGAAAELVVDVDDSDADVAVVLSAIVASIVDVFAGIDVVVDPAAVVVRRRATSLSIAVPAPIDRLMAAADGLELAIRLVVEPLSPPSPGPPPASDGDGEGPLSIDALRASLTTTLAAEQNPRLVALAAAAAARGVPFFADDDGVSVGLGRGGFRFAADAVPDVDDVDWSAAAGVPAAFITGTNGKTTTTRLLTSILEATGEPVGATSTDTLRIAGENVDTGDWSGPGGARRVLRDPRVAYAALETARGGLLRRGLAFVGADVAVVTNVAADHLGEFGVNDLDDMAEVKLVVAQGVKEGGAVVINADDGILLRRARQTLSAEPRRRRVLFARTRGAVIDEHLAAGHEAWFVDHGVMVRGQGQARVEVVDVASVPVTMGGALGFNVENALAAAAAASAMGVDDDTIARGLQALHPDGAGVPGRGNTFVDDAGRVVVVDFAHNPAAIMALWSMLHVIGDGQPKGHRTVVAMGAPGDRQDAELIALAVAVASGGPDLIVVRELRGYLRGRGDGEVPALLKASLRGAGVADSAIVDADDDVSGVIAAIDAAAPGDVVALTPIVNMPGVLQVLHERGFQPRV